MQFIEVDNSLAVARIALQGAHVDWWRPKSVKQDVLWRSTSVRYEKGRSIRGGVPICWPWFGNHPTDKIKNFNLGIEKNYITFNGEFDRAYTNTSNDCYIEDDKFNRVITVKKSNSNSTVVWTPGGEKAMTMGDMGEEEEWRRMVCVETTNLLENSVVIYPQLSHSIATEYSVQEY